MPFLLLPFRPASDPSAARSFVRNYFGNGIHKPSLQGEYLLQELRLIEPPVNPTYCAGLDRLTNKKQVLCSILKWCWGRLPGGVVTWEAYELFKIGEQGEIYFFCSI